MKGRNIFLRFLIVLILGLGCQKKDQQYLFELVSPDFSGIHFSNDLPISDELNIFNYMYYYNGAGVAVADINNDGWTDIIFSSNLGKEKIYLNKGNWQFEDISEMANVDGGPNSWTNGVAVADVNNDGLIDIYLSQVGNYRQLDCTNKLFICTGIDSSGVPNYREMSEDYGVDFKGFSTQAGFFDYDLDGDVDMFLMNHSLHHNGTFGKRESFLDTYHPESGDQLYRNDGNFFTNVTQTSGIHSSVIGYGLGLAFGDFNDDNWPDIYIGNDFHENDYLYINQKNGTFKDTLESVIKSTSKFSMGVDVADINNDCKQDIISLDMLPEDPYILKTSEGEEELDVFNYKLDYGYNYQYARNALQINNGSFFKELGRYAEIQATDWSWSPLFVDFDLDGNKDLFISNGIPKRMNDLDYISFVSGNELQYKIQFDDLKKEDLSVLDSIPEIKLFNKIYLGKDSLRFEDISKTVKFGEESYSNSAAYADFDNDGDYDLVCNNINGRAFLYNNKLDPKGVKIVLMGYEGDPFSLGAKIEAAYADKKNILVLNNATRGFQSSMIGDPIVPKDGLETIKVTWPDGKYSVSRFEGGDQMKVDYRLIDTISSNISPTYETIYFTDITGLISPQIVHDENVEYNEFKREPLIPWSTSREGPALAVADINGDGLQDFFLGSSMRHRHGIFYQTEDGNFTMTDSYENPSDTIYEEVDAEFIDVDGDDDMDLVVATGGNEFKLNSPFSEPLLYMNEDGQLHRNPNAFTNIRLVASCVAPCDFDNDGDVDLFFGARAEPWNYGQKPISYLLSNDGQGHFSNVTEEVSKVLGQHGMVKDAIWTDIDQNGYSDLVISYEWGKVEVFYNENGRLQNRPVSDMTGWWNGLAILDVDGDGHDDILVGNTGENTRLRATPEEPVRMYINDFDDNNKEEQLITYYVEGKEIPFARKMDLQALMPIIKKKFLFAKQFASKSIKEIFSGRKLRESLTYEVNSPTTTLFINKGNGQFQIGRLPQEVQFSSTITSLPIDINQDGKLDLFLGCNYFDNNVQMGRYDADRGSVLINSADNKLSYHQIDNNPLEGQIKQIKTIDINGYGNCVLIAQNNNQLKIFSVK